MITSSNNTSKGECQPKIFNILYYAVSTGAKMRQELSKIAKMPKSKLGKIFGKSPGRERVLTGSKIFDPNIFN